MEDIILLEETIRMTLRREAEGLSEERLENAVVGQLGRSGDPVERSAYQTAIGNLVERNIIQETTISVEGYAANSQRQVPGYILS